MCYMDILLYSVKEQEKKEISKDIILMFIAINQNKIIY